VSPIEEMLAIEAIKRLKARYFRCLDTKDWNGYLAVFTPDARIDSSWAGIPIDYTGKPRVIDGVVPPPPTPEWDWHDPVKFVENLSKLLENVTTVHHGHMPEIELTSPTTATGIWAMEDKLLYPQAPPSSGPRGSGPQGGTREMHGYGHYTETYERQADGWRIKSLRLTRVRVDYRH
jgi:SnoaL-like domain